MKEIPEAYRLYCINGDCKISVHANIRDNSLPLEGFNFVDTAVCPACKEPLALVLDFELQQMVIELGGGYQASPY